MAKDKDDAKAEGFKRGLAGKVGATNLLQGWTDDRAAGTARAEGYAAGKKKRRQNAAAQAARDKA
jgi:hypothetical protein